MQHQLLRYAYMKLARELDARFENLLLTGRVTKWYSEVGNEATTVPAGLVLQAGDVLCTLHRDLASGPIPRSSCTASRASSWARPTGSRRASSGPSTTAT
jgi:TPP-dependent pyruvate/acetoin dehydrogenase alpha subunit